MLRDEFGGEYSDEDGVGIEERDVNTYLERLEEDITFEMNLLTEEDSNLERIEKESRQTIQEKLDEIKDVDQNIEMLQQSLLNKQTRIEFYQQLLTQSENQSAAAHSKKMGGSGLQGKKGES